MLELEARGLKRLRQLGLRSWGILLERSCLVSCSMDFLSNIVPVAVRIAGCAAATLWSKNRTRRGGQSKCEHLLPLAFAHRRSRLDRGRRRHSESRARYD